MTRGQAAFEAGMRRGRPDSWYSTPRAKRNRGQIALTISHEARAALEEMSEPGRRSEFVEGLILSEHSRRRARS